MKVLICGICEPLLSTINHYISAFIEEGNEVATCGPFQGNYEGPYEAVSAYRTYKNPYVIPIHDKKPYPPYYSYKEILDKCPWKPELIVQVEPHFFFQGTRSERQNIPVAYLTFDNHRGPLTHLEAVRKGNIDQIFINSLYFMRPYTDQFGTDKVTWLPVAANPKLHHPRPEISEQCDVAWTGNHGIMNSGSAYEEWLDKTGVKSQFPYSDKRFWLWKLDSVEPYWQEYVEYAKSGDNILMRLADAAPWEKYNGWEHREYVERAEYIFRLCKDFNVFVFSTAVLQNYSLAIAQGRIGFNCSLRNDINMKLFEYSACGKMVVTDYVEGLDQLMPAGAGWIYYKKYYQGDNVNFGLDYTEVKGKMQLYLNRPDERLEVARKGQEHILKFHTYRHRVRKIVETMFGCAK